MLSLFHDDITWCMSECPIHNCMRNPVNMMDHTGLHSYANFRGTDMCPVYKSEDGCMHLCAHVEECFSEYKDPDVALRELGEQYCDHCMFSSMEED